MLKESSYHGYPIVDTRDSMHLVGFVYRLDLQQALASSFIADIHASTTFCLLSHRYVPSPSTATTLDLRAWVDQTPVQISPEFPVTSTADFFTKLGLRYVLVTDQGRLKGLITKKDMIVYLDNKQENSTDPEHHHRRSSLP